MSTPESPDSPQVKLMHEWDRAFGNKDMDLLAKLLHKDYRYTGYPRSLGKPDKTKEEWLEHTKGILNIRTAHERTLHSVTEVPGKVIVHASNKAKTVMGIDMNRESISIIHFVTDEDGSLKIKQIEEFIDTKTYFDFLQAVQAAKAAK